MSPIKLDGVAALFGIAARERAPKALFATTSTFQPKAREWALATETELDLPSVELADGSKIAGWCSEIGQTLSDNFAKGLAEPPTITEATGPLTGSIVLATNNHSWTSNYFAKIEADFPYEVILRPIGQKMVSGGFENGAAVPSAGDPVNWTKHALLLAHKTKNGYFNADRKLFAIWDGKPQ